MVEVLMSAVVGKLSAWRTKWETNGQTFFYKYKDKDETSLPLQKLRRYGFHVLRYGMRISRVYSSYFP